MNRADAASFIELRLAGYLVAASRPATDTSKGLKEPIDDALRALGYLEASLATATTTTAVADQDLRVQGMYRTLLQIMRDLGASHFDIGVSGDSFKLSQVRAAVEKDLALAEAAVLVRFGTTDIVLPAGDAILWTINTNYLEENLVDMVG